MIKRLKRKVIALTMTSLFVLLALIIFGMNVLNYHTIVREADRTLQFLNQDRGGTMDPFQKPEWIGPFEQGFSPELPYESRYFIVSIDKNGNVIQTDVSKIASINEETAAQMGQKVASRKSDAGFSGDFRYQIARERNGIRVIFLDCGRKLDAFHNFLYSSIAISVLGLAAVFLVIVFISGRIVRPIAQSYEKQKRFITDAGHEIKTPLTIISANVDVLEMDVGAHECLDEVRAQTRRLAALTGDLVMLTRMEEAESNMPMIAFPASEVVEDAVAAFRAPALSHNKQLDCHIQKWVKLKGNDKAIAQLVNLLLDNALKYSPEGSTIRVHFEKSGKNVHLSVSNPTQTVLDSENLDRIFDRFYRLDPSRNSETGGHGIGLSVAKAIVTAHSGKISANYSGDGIFQINVTLPM